MKLFGDEIYTRSEMGIGLALIGLESFLSLFLIRNDFRLISSHALIFGVVGLRISTMAAVSVSALVIHRRPEPRIYVKAISVSAFLGLVLAIVATISRPFDYAYGSYITIMIIACFYFVVPMPLFAKIAPAAILSLVDITMILFAKKIPETAKLAATLSYIGINLIGIYNATLVRRFRREEREHKKNLENEIRIKAAISDAVFDGIAIHREGAIVDTNSALRDMLDMEESEINERPLYSLFEAGGELAVARSFEGEAAVDAVLLGKESVLPVEIRSRRISIAGLEHVATLFHDASDREIVGVHQAMLERDAVPSRAAFEDRIASMPLSNRERDIVRATLEGKTRSEIAELLFISTETVKKHTSNIYAKLGIASKVELARRVLEG